MLILLDMDGVLADLDEAFYQAWQQQFSHLFPAIAKEKRRHFYIRDDYPTEFLEQIQYIQNSKGFYRHIPVMKGAKKAVQALLEAGHELRICTSPLLTNNHCASEKFAWVEEHLGSDFLSRIIIAKDKTWVRGDILIDDKPIITGALKPEWQAIIYDHPYNRSVDGARLTWENWQAVLADYKQPKN